MSWYSRQQCQNTAEGGGREQLITYEKGDVIMIYAKDTLYHCFQ